MNRLVRGSRRSDDASRATDLGSPDVDGALLVASVTRAAEFAGFYDRNYDAVQRYFFRRTACPEVAADLTAETFAAALEGAHRFKPDKGTGQMWLWGIAGNLFRQWARRGELETRARKRLSMVTPQLTGADVERVEDLVDLRAQIAALPTAMDALSPAARQAVDLRVTRQLSYAEVARQLGCSEVSARVRVSRGLGRLYQELESA